MTVPNQRLRNHTRDYTKTKPLFKDLRNESLRDGLTTQGTSWDKGISWDVSWLEMGDQLATMTELGGQLAKMLQLFYSTAPTVHP